MTIHHQTQSHEQTKKMYYSTDTKFFGLLKRGVVSRSSVFKIIAILGILFGMGLIIQYNNKCQNELKQYQQLQLFLKIDDLGHEGIIDVWKRREYVDGIEEFYEIDDKFHNTSIVSEKLVYAREMMVLYEELDTHTHKIGGIDTPEDIARDKKYHELVTLFKQYE